MADERAMVGSPSRGLVTSCVLSVSLLLIACAPADQAEAWSARTDAIRNGTQQPQVFALSAGEQLAIGWLFAPGTPQTSFCTGTLVDGRTIVTARHCVEGRTPGTLGFGVGIDPTAPRSTFALEAIELPSDPTVDLAVLRLAEDARRAVPELVPITLNRTDLAGAFGQGLVGQPVDAAGYGDTMDATRTGRWFAQVVVAEITEGFVVVDGQGRQGICFGDSGGPVIAADAQGVPVVLGVEHAGDESCLGIDHLVRLDRWSGWIDEVRGSQGEGCGSLDFQGACAGDVAVWCDDSGRLARRDCTLDAEACGFVNDRVGFYCAEKDAFGRADGLGASTLPPAPSTFKGGCAQSDSNPGAPWIAALGLLALLAVRRR
jgi:MYXO-CTERM domain-containing protein